MKKTFLWAFALVAGVVVAAPMQPYNPYYHNALADIRLHVADEMGSPVEGATVRATFYTSDVKTETIEKVTDAKGVFEARHLCNWELSIYVRKEGYYETDFETKAFITLSKPEVTKTKCWSNGTVDIPVVIKMKREPVKLDRHAYQYWTIPATNEICSIDLEKLQWCPPYGKGRHADLELLYETVEHPEEGWYVSYWRRLKISMPNCADGFYLAERDSFSHFQYAYLADTNAVFMKELVLEVERKNDRMVKTSLPAPGEYLIFRTRTATNSLGQVIRANYGRIGDGLNMDIGLSLKTWFNPLPNDVNLEDARPW